METLHGTSETRYATCSSCRPQQQQAGGGGHAPSVSSGGRGYVPSGSSGGTGKAIGCLVLLFLGAGMVFGACRWAGCDFAKSEAEKNVGKEIGWGAKADLDPGKRYEFICPKDGTPGDVVGGSDLNGYGEESSICTAAVHAGLFSLKDGGRVTIDVQEKKGLVIRGSERNGIKSFDQSRADDRAEFYATKDAGPPDWSDKVFSVVGAPPPPPVAAPSTKPASSAVVVKAAKPRSAPAKPGPTVSAKPAAVPSGDTPSE
jgi:hypothetical protein